MKTVMLVTFVLFSLPSCIKIQDAYCIGNGSFQLSGFAIQKFSNHRAINNYNNYELSFANTSAELDVYFPVKPNSGTYNAHYDPNFLSSGECCVNFSNFNGSYISTEQGAVQVNVSNTGTDITSCNIPLISPYNNASYGGSANLTGD